VSEQPNCAAAANAAVIPGTTSKCHTALTSAANLFRSAAEDERVAALEADYVAMFASMRDHERI